MQATKNIFTSNQLSTAVLLLIFKRIDTTRRVFEAIRQAKPPRLYIAADGHRSDIPNEEKQVLEVRNYVLNNIDWDCKVKTLFQERNKGCGVAVTKAINWFFEFEETGIIFEDDVLPDPSFFPFCEELLKRYRDELRVMAIGGSYFAGEKNRPANSYYFSRYPHLWGWATWRRAWKNYDWAMSKWTHLKNTNILRQLAHGEKYFVRYWSQIFDMVQAGRTDIWDYRFTLACWINSGLSIVPCRNLIKNIGFGTDATHTADDSFWIANLPLERMTFPLNHPLKIEQNIEVDRWSSRYVFGIKFIALFKLWIMQRSGRDILTKIYRFFKNILQKINQLW